MAGTNQIASDTWVPQTDKFGNQVNPVWAQQGNGTAEQVSQYNSMIRDLATRALSTSGAGADAFNFAGYTLPNNKYVQQALQGWTPPETKVLDPISGRLTSTTKLSYADALAKLGVTPGTTSTYTADKTFAPNDAMAGFSQEQKNALAGSFSDIGNQQNKASYISSPLVNKTIPVTNDPSPNTQSLISNTPKPGYIKGYDTNNGYKQVYVPAGKYVPGISLYPKPTNTITPDKMKNETPINVPGTPTNGASPVGAGEANAMIAGGKTAMSDLIQQLTPAQTDAEKKQQALLDQMASLTGQEANRAADQLTAEQSANLPQLRQQFAEINGQIMTKSAEYDALVKAQEGKPITMSSIIGSERAILNAKASDIGMLTARAQALQGQIETAQSTVNRSIDLKYSSIDARLNMYQAQLNALQPTLTKEEKIRAQAQQVLLDERKQVLEDQKNQEKQLSNFNIQMMAKYPSAGILPTDSYAATNAKVVKSKEYLQDQSMNNLDVQYKQAQIANIQSEIAKRNIEGSGANYDPALIAAYAQQYGSTGTIPSGIPKGSFGVISQTAKQLPKPVGTLIDINTGVKSSSIGEEAQKSISALYDITRKVEDLKQMDTQRWGGLVAGALGKITGSENQARYISLRDEIVDLLARARSGAVLTADEEKRYADMLPGRFSEPFGAGTDSQIRIDNFAKNIAGSLDAKLKNYGLEIVGYGDNANRAALEKASQFDDTGNPNKPLSMGGNGSSDVVRFSAAIGQFESGGRYNAVGPDTGNGNKALGRYQVMASNVPSWTKEALGKSLTPQQFLNSPEAQDAVAHYKMGQYYEKYGNWGDVASVWFSGRPLKKAGNAKDVIGTSTPQYVKNVLAIYDRMS